MIKGDVTIKYSEKNILKLGKIISKLLFEREDMFQGLERYLRDEVPFIYTDNFMGCYLGIMQNPENLDLFSLEVIDILNGESNTIDLTDRLIRCLGKCSEFDIIMF